MDTNQIMIDTKKMIDDLKTVCGNYGLGNAPSEYKIITEVFLYKYLNDKFLHEIRCLNDKRIHGESIEADLDKLSEEEYEDLLDDLPASTALLEREHLISYLFNRKNQKKSEGVKSFHELFDDTLTEISNNNVSIFSVHAGGEDVIKLFDSISQYVIESNKRDDFCRALIDKLVDFSFEGVFEQKYDFFASIFEYLIKDYNKDFGKYAEYYTPHSIASIIAKIMVPSAIKNVTVYDPAAGSGTLVLALAHEIGEENCTIYTQDITQKSNEFMRLNLILNNLVHSLGNVIHGDTLLSPQHYNKQKNGLMHFDYIVSNPPFNVDFSDNRDTLAGENYKERFWAGVPAVPKKDLDSMDIYLLFIQHIIYSMKENGKAAIVVPTGFLTKKNKIEKAIKKHIIDNKMLRAVISMPSNIFATTGTNVSIMFLDAEKKRDKALLVDATGFGEKVKLDGKTQKTLLSPNEINEIISILNDCKILDDISILVDINDIKKKKYTFSAGEFFEAKFVYDEMTSEEFNQKIDEYSKTIKELTTNGKEIDIRIMDALRSVHYDI